MRFCDIQHMQVVIFVRNRETSKLANILLSDWDIQGSNPGLEISHPRIILGFPQWIQENSGHNRFYPRTFQLIAINHLINRPYIVLATGGIIK